MKTTILSLALSLFASNAFAGAGPIITIPKSVNCMVQSKSTSSAVSGLLNQETRLCQPTLSPYPQECFHFSYIQTLTAADNSPRMSLNILIDDFSGEVRSPVRVSIALSNEVQEHLSDKREDIVRDYQRIGQSARDISEAQLQSGYQEAIQIPVLSNGKLEVEEGTLECSL